MKDCSLIIWDEASLSHKASVEALDRTMQDLHNSNCPMGGCTVLFSGDFRQMLSVITRGREQMKSMHCSKDRILGRM